MDSVAYLVNSTPKYFYLLPLHFQLIQRYAPAISWDLFLATEVPDHPICQQLVTEFGVKLLKLDPAESGFLDSRAAALEALLATNAYTYVLPVQEDFLLDRAPDLAGLEAAVDLMRLNPSISSVRLMPSPAPGGSILGEDCRFAKLGPETDTYGFTFQATLWNLKAATRWYKAITQKLEEEWPRDSVKAEKRIAVEVRYNFAENPDGQRFFWKFSNESGYQHVGWRRAGPWRNAVYLSPWPYRPTAIVQGRLEPWAAEMAERESVHL